MHLSGGFSGGVVTTLRIPACRLAVFFPSTGGVPAREAHKCDIFSFTMNVVGGLRR